MRLLTAIAVIGICGFAAARGWGIVHFSADMASSGSSERRPEIINKWTSTPYVASAALRAELREQTDSEQSATNRRWGALSSMLAIRPLSSVDWLSLSILQRATDQPMENVFRSLEM
jgi:hypothetical protein